MTRKAPDRRKFLNHEPAKLGNMRHISAGGSLACILNITSLPFLVSRACFIYCCCVSPMVLHTIALCCKVFIHQIQITTWHGKFVA